MAKLTDRELVAKYISARDRANAAEAERLQLRDVLLPRLREKHGRLITKSGVILLRLEERRFAHIKAIDLLVLTGRLKAQSIAPAISNSEIERIIAEGIPEIFSWEKNGSNGSKNDSVSGISPKPVVEGRKRSKT